MRRQGLLFLDGTLRSELSITQNLKMYREANLFKCKLIYSIPAQ